MLTLWNDWRFDDLELLRREMDRLFAADVPRVRGEPVASGPQFELFERDTELEVRAEVPGLAEQDLAIQLEPTLLTVRAQRRADAPEGYAVHRQERRGFAIDRSFTLPCKVDPDKASATLKDGVLTLRLPKAPELQPRQITVTAS